MAKDGTARGGARVGAGRKSKALNEKIVEGKAKKVLSFSEPAELNGEEMPPVKEYMKSRQKSGVPLCAEEVYRDTWLWLQERGCEKLVNAQLLTNYAMSVSRWIQCEECISEFGFLAKHPTTGNAIASPYVAMAQAYMKGNYNRSAHYNESRYHMLNLHATFTKGTIEFRLFQFDNPHDNRKRTRSPVAPNVILELYFSLGSSQEISLGRWHIDRASTDIPGNQITVSARNTIGKLLKEQTFDENCTFSAPTFHENLEEILKFAGIEKFFVTESKYNWQLSFDPDTTILSGIEDAIKVISTWQIRENSDGVIGIGRRTDARFEQPSVFSFERERDCFKYSSEYSDEDTYSRLCITREEPEHSFYEELPAHKLWPIPAHRTLYVKVPDGTSVELMHSYAADIKAAIAISGRQETFAARFTPQLMIGDSVRMKTQEQNKIIGVVTSIKHTLGRKGFYTEFTIDSGGRRSKPKLKDYLSNISNKKKSAYIVTEKDEG